MGIRPKQSYDFTNKTEWKISMENSHLIELIPRELWSLFDDTLNTQQNLTFVFGINTYKKVYSTTFWKLKTNRILSNFERNHGYNFKRFEQRENFKIFLY